MKRKNVRTVGLVFLCTASLFLTQCSTVKKSALLPEFLKSKEIKGGVTDKEVAQFLRTVRPYQGNPDSHYQLACYYQQRSRHKEAIEEFRKVIYIDPNYVKAYNGLGVSYDLTRDFPMAVECYEKALKLNPNLGYVQNNLGYSYLLQGKHDEAITAFKRAVALNGQDKKVHNNLGLAYAMNNQIDVAMEEFKLAGDEGQAYYNIAQLYYKKGFYKEAQSNYSKALAADSSLSRAKTGFEAAEAMARISPQPPSAEEAMKEVLIIPEQPSFINKEAPEGVAPDILVSLNPEPFKPQEPVVEKREVVYEIQVASSRSPQNANVAVKSLQRSGYRASVRNWQSEDGNEWHRITVGSFPTRDEAITFKEKIEKEYDYKPLIIQSIVVKTDREPLAIQDEGTAREQLASLKEIKVEISNGNGVRRMAGRVGTYLRQNGVRVVRLTNANNFRYRNTRIYYQEGYRDAAYYIFSQLPGVQSMEPIRKTDRPHIKVKILIGKDIVPYDDLFSGKILLSSLRRAG